MVLAIGIVVDDAIVVVENVEHKLEETTLSVPEAVKEAMGDHRADPRHHARIAVGVRACGFHSGNRRAALPAVCGHGLGSNAPVGASMR